MTAESSVESRGGGIRRLLWRALGTGLLVGVALLGEWISRRLWPDVPWLEALRSGLFTVLRSSETQWEIVACLMVYFVGFQWLRQSLRRDRSWRAPRPVLLTLLVAVATTAYVRDYHGSVPGQDYLTLLAAITGAQGLALWMAWDGRSGGDCLAGRVFIRVFGLWILALALVHPDWGTSFEYREQSRWKGLWLSPNVYGILMASGCAAATVCLLESLERARRVEAALWLTALGVAGVGLVFSLSRGAWLGAGLALSFLLVRLLPTFGCRLPAWMLTRRFAVQVGILVISSYLIGFWTLRFSEQPLVRRAFTVFNPNDFSWRNRVATIPGSLQMMGERPLLGHGWNRPESIYTSLYKPDFMVEGGAVTQNHFLMFGMTLGLPALIGFLGWIGLSLRSGGAGPPAAEGLDAAGYARLAAVAAVIPFLVGFLFDGVLFRWAIAVPFFCFMEIAASRPEPAAGATQQPEPKPAET